jgi:hypothetical protein
VRCATRSGIVSVWVGQWSHLGKPNEDKAPTRPARRRGFFGSGAGWQARLEDVTNLGLSPGRGFCWASLPLRRMPVADSAGPRSGIIFAGGFPIGAFDFQDHSKGRHTVMPDRRRIAAKAIIAVGAYLHPNFYVGDQDKKLWQMQSDAPITDMDANFLESWTWAKHPSLAAALENSIFEALEDTTIA